MQEPAACTRCHTAQAVVKELQSCLNQVVTSYDREIKRLTKDLERARARNGAGGTAGVATSASEIISYGNIPGFAEEMKHLGDCYMHGTEGHLRDSDRAFKYYEAAAVHGCAESSLRVGKYYLNGPESDDGKALFFLTVAANEGSAEAAYRVGMMHYAGVAGSGSESEAGRWLEQAMAGGHVFARYQLATMYAQGDGMPQDRLKAHELFQAWEEQCAQQEASEPAVTTTGGRSLSSTTSPRCVRQGAELKSQVDSVRDRIAKLSIQLQSPSLSNPHK